MTCGAGRAVRSRKPGIRELGNDTDQPLAIVRACDDVGWIQFNANSTSDRSFEG
jgi:hypothetical protein